TFYGNIVNGKLLARQSVSRSLIKSIWRTLQEFRNGKLAQDQLQQILQKQLSGFNLPGPEELVLMSRAENEKSLGEFFGKLEAGEVQIQYGKETSRIVQDLYAEDLFAMRTDIFGGEKTDQETKKKTQVERKVEYRISEQSPELTMRFHISKRKVHA